MPHYLIQASYTPQALAALAKNPEDREKGARALIEGLGGRMHSFFYAQGEYDVIGIMEAPDAETANAFALAVISPGHLKSCRTTPLFTMQETLRAMRRAGEAAYRAPGQGST